MQLHLKQLNQHLKGTLLPIYLLSGDVPLLLQESRDAIRHAGQQSGYENYQRLDVEPGFNWGTLMQHANSYSLFGERTFIELHNPTAKFETEAGKILLSYCESPPTDKILLIVTSKLSSAQQKTRWYKTISEQGAVLAIWPVKAAELSQWIQQRLQQAGLTADAASIRMLAELTEGNLLATQQAIIKLKLLYPKHPIGIKQMAEVISDSAQFNIFELSQYLLQGDSRNVIRILHHLRDQDTEPTLVLWLLAKECRELLNMADQLKQGKSISEVLASQWTNLKPLYQTALRRLPLTKLKGLLAGCHEIDKTIKGVKLGDAWQSLTLLSLDFASGT